ncbi:GNAT family N-acetyltransferase [Xanthobacter autotrophicus DSM 597]|uniref:GNAT family N-acetyltransferase n=1 Tax=Xanthobacter TaxID=279 RepID=UPI001AE6703F|nr:GNAT family N-acetyltransferase [Xanthobacter flavus]MBP2148667.1 putative acetyltransferase [Xanthobacter flavus]
MSDQTAPPPFPAYALSGATPRDRPAMAQLWVETWAKTMPDIDFVARLPWLESHLDGLSAGGALIRVAREGGEDGQVAGFVVIHPGTGYLDQLAVAPRVWGKGAAEALMAEARRISPTLVALDVNQDNPRAVRFYEKMGLAIVSEGANPMSGRLTYRMEWRGA